MTNRILQRGKDSGRVDDNSESIKKRFLTSINETGPIIESFRSINQLVEVDSQSPIQEVFGCIRPHFEKLQ